jgi:peptidoglycan/LPS O-acetylase OafA/YrhL
VLSRRQGGQPYEAALGSGSILSHVLLFHNVKFDWAYRINGPMWSVATEWQIYFVFALAMLPFFRRFGMGATLIVSWVLGSLPFFLLPSDENFFWACPWFIGSFAFGMAGATIGFAPAFKESWLRNKAPWGVLTWASFALLVGLVWSGLADAWPYPVIDLVVSVFAFALINACVVRSTPGRESESLLVRIFGSKALVYLGGFSYSLYLVQHPVFRFTEKMAPKFIHNADVMALFHLSVVVPVIMLFAWFFAELFERPFTSGGIVLPALRRLRRTPEPTVMPQR